ncbi:hypothetical protein LAZ67_8000916 [Cordylochernes scorpioides]|uniref:Uncharacterized protein n=1 Tax=Cordylochernes scorpioides TaxID=51811 RepID=A0ABY6KRD3_9ARAC|nr:hypothetical protein LAZ67_8000916 [Cordylochernes scorpioides]
MPGHKPMKDRLTLLLCANARLEVNEPIIQELVEEEDQELTTNELIDLHREQHQEVKEVISSGEEEDENSLGSLPSDQIREICKMWETVQLFVAKHHPNKPAALRATDQFNDNAMSHFRGILKKRQKQQSLDHRYFRTALLSLDHCHLTAALVAAVLALICLRGFMQDAELSSVNPQLSPGPGATGQRTMDEDGEHYVDPSELPATFIRPSLDNLVSRLTEALQEVTASRAYASPMAPYYWTYLAKTFFRQL